MSARHLGFAAVAAFLVSAASLSAQAQNTDANGWVGGAFGLHIPDYEDTSARPAFGISGGAKLGSEWGIGGYYLNSSKEETINGATADFNYTMYGVEGAYHFEGEAAGVYLGGRLGMTTLEVGAADVKPVHWGLLAGYNHWLMDNFSLGGEASFINVAAGDDTIGGVSVPIEGFNIIAFHATAKFWF